LALTAEFLRLRREHPALRAPSRRTQTVTEDETKKVIAIHRFYEHSHMLQLLNFADTPAEITPPYFEGTWTRLLCSAAERWGGTGNIPARTATHGTPLTLPPHSITLYEHEGTG
jgi:maltooligosyltrehalose trehalohydrolase